MRGSWCYAYYFEVLLQSVQRFAAWVVFMPKTQPTAAGKKGVRGSLSTHD